MSIDLHTIDTGNQHGSSWHPAVTRDDVADAVKRDREQRGQLSPAALMHEIAGGIRAAERRLRMTVSDHERDAVTQEVALKVHERHGWTPARVAVGRHYLTALASAVLSDRVLSYADSGQGTTRPRVNGRPGERVARAWVSVDAATADDAVSDPGDVFSVLADDDPTTADQLADDLRDLADALADRVADADPDADDDDPRAVALSGLDRRRVAVALAVALESGALAGDDDDAPGDTDQLPVSRVADAYGLSLDSASKYRRTGAQILRERMRPGQLVAWVRELAVEHGCTRRGDTGETTGLRVIVRDGKRVRVVVVGVGPARWTLTPGQRAALDAINATLAAANKLPGVYRSPGKRDAPVRVSVPIMGPVVGGQLAADRTARVVADQGDRERVAVASLPTVQARNVDRVRDAIRATRNPVCALADYRPGQWVRPAYVGRKPEQIDAAKLPGIGGCPARVPSHLQPVSIRG